MKIMFWGLGRKWKKLKSIGNESRSPIDNTFDIKIFLNNSLKLENKRKELKMISNTKNKVYKSFRMSPKKKSLLSQIKTLQRPNVINQKRSTTQLFKNSKTCSFQLECWWVQSFYSSIKELLYITWIHSKKSMRQSLHWSTTSRRNNLKFKMSSFWVRIRLVLIDPILFMIELFILLVLTEKLKSSKFMWDLDIKDPSLIFNLK